MHSMGHPVRSPASFALPAHDVATKPAMHAGQLLQVWFDVLLPNPVTIAEWDPETSAAAQVAFGIGQLHHVAELLAPALRESD